MWSLLLTIPGLLLLLLVWVLVAPIRLRVDSRREIVDAGIAGLVRVWLDTSGDQWRLRMRVLFFRVRMGRGKKKKKKTKEDRPERKKKKSGRFNAVRVWRYITAVAGTFRLRRCRLELDTGDYPLNAQLYAFKPVLAARGIDLDINFEGRNEVDLLIRNNAGRIAWALIRKRLRK